MSNCPHGRFGESRRLLFQNIIIDHQRRKPHGLGDVLHTSRFMKSNTVTPRCCNHRHRLRQTTNELVGPILRRGCDQNLTGRDQKILCRELRCGDILVIHNHVRSKHTHSTYSIFFRTCPSPSGPLYPGLYPLQSALDRGIKPHSPPFLSGQGWGSASLGWGLP